MPGDVGHHVNSAAPVSHAAQLASQQDRQNAVQVEPAWQARKWREWRASRSNTCSEETRCEQHGRTRQTRSSEVVSSRPVRTKQLAVSSDSVWDPSFQLSVSRLRSATYLVASVQKSCHCRGTGPWQCAFDGAAITMHAARQKPHKWRHGAGQSCDAATAFGRAQIAVVRSSQACRTCRRLRFPSHGLRRRKHCTSYQLSRSAPASGH